MIGGKNDQRFLKKAAMLQERQEIPEYAILVIQFGRITGFAVALTRVLREIVG